MIHYTMQHHHEVDVKSKIDHMQHRILLKHVQYCKYDHWLNDTLIMM